MLTRTIDRLEMRLAPHAKAISIAAIVWFWLGVGLNAGFVALPDLPWPIKPALFWGGVVANAVWWGWLRPAIERRRHDRQRAGQDALPPQA